MSTTVITPERSREQQRMDALMVANDTRSRRAQMKRDLKCGRCSPADVLADPPEWLESMRVRDLLVAVPRVGPVHAHRMLKLLDVSLAKRVGALSPRQRQGLAARLAGGVSS